MGKTLTRPCEVHRTESNAGSSAETMANHKSILILGLYGAGLWEKTLTRPCEVHRTETNAGFSAETIANQKSILILALSGAGLWENSNSPLRSTQG